MSISASGSNYISNANYDDWLQSKLEDAYGEIRQGMDVSGHRTDATKALNTIKNELLQMKTNGKDASEVTAAIHQAIEEFGEEFPDVKKALGEFADSLDQRAKAAIDASNLPTTEFDSSNDTVRVVPPTHIPEPVKLSDKEIDDITNSIKDTVDGFGKDDQLGLIHLNQLNSRINQTENLFSSLSDSRNKTIDAIINRIG